MHASSLGAILSLFLAGILPTFGLDPLARPFPQEARGDLHFQADAARFLENGKPVAEVALSIPDEGLGGGADTARVTASVELLDWKENGRGAYRTRLVLPPAEAAGPQKTVFPVPRRWLRLTAPWVEEGAGLKVRVEDESRLKAGLFDRLRHMQRAGEASGRMAEREGSFGPASWMSDLLFVWGAAVGTTAPEGTGLRAVRARLEPNPYRYYGLYQPILSVYWERYTPPTESELIAGSPLLARSRILRLVDSVEVSSKTETLRVAPDAQWTLKRFDLSQMEAGSYRFDVTLFDGRSATPRVLGMAAGDFQVVWERANWTLDEGKLLAYGRVLLPAARFADFEELDRGGRENYLRDLWTRVGSNGPGAENPAEERFLERVRYAEESFGGRPRGILSDRGRVYVRYGPPDEIRTELNPQDQTLLWIALPQEVDRSGADNLDDLQRQSRRRTPEDNRAYEIWEYTVWGDPLLPEYIPPGSKHGMKFIFVDEQGTGDLTLAYTNAPTSLQ